MNINNRVPTLNVIPIEQKSQHSKCRLSKTKLKKAAIFFKILNHDS